MVTRDICAEQKAMGTHEIKYSVFSLLHQTRFFSFSVDSTYSTPFTARQQVVRHWICTQAMRKERSSENETRRSRRCISLMIVGFFIVYECRNFRTKIVGYLADVPVVNGQPLISL